MELFNYIRICKDTVASKASQIAKLLIRAIQVAWMPWNEKATPMYYVHNSEVEKEELILEWYNGKLVELNIVTVTSTLIAAVVTQTMAWTVAPIPPWPVKVCWLSSLTQALIGTAIATQQIVTLSRIRCQPNGILQLRALIIGAQKAQHPETNDTVKPHRAVIFVWGASTMLLGSSIMFFIIGLVIALCHAAKLAGYWGADIKIAICYFISFCYPAAVYMVCWKYTEWRA